MSHRRQYATGSPTPWRDALPGLAAAAAIAAAAVLERHHRSGLCRPGPPGPTPVPPAGPDVVVPARNEAASIGRCLEALLASTPPAGITVVDDASDDGTGALAAGTGATVLRTEGPPAGWLGKPHACHLGARRSSAAWLAFVDADVVLASGALGTLVAHAEAAGADAVSPLLAQRCSRPADRLLVPLAFWQYLVGLPGAGRGRAILNGQCIVVRRRAYEAAGGHAHPAVRGSVVEDSALARRLVATGHSVRLLDGRELGEVRMYRGLAEVRAGFGKNAAAFLAADPARGALVAGAGIALSQAPRLLARALRRRTPEAAAGAAAAYAAGVVALAGSYRRAGEPAALALLHPVAAPVMQAIAVESAIRRVLGRPPRWRGRELRP